MTPSSARKMLRREMSRHTTSQYFRRIDLSSIYHERLIGKCISHATEENHVPLRYYLA